jgi:hypothetical protein
MNGSDSTRGRKLHVPIGMASRPQHFIALPCMHMINLCHFTRTPSSELHAVPLESEKGDNIIATFQSKIIRLMMYRLLSAML